MGMPITVDVVDSVRGGVVDAVFADLNLIDRTFSPFLETSAVSRINRGELAAADAGALVQQVLDLCRLYEVDTDGYFTAWIGGRLDPSGLVKGWAIDRACSILDQHGCRNYLVDAGGDVQTRGRNHDRQPWRVGIRHPIQRDRVARVVHPEGLAVATSGNYEKGEHIVNARTGERANGLLSFTVVGQDILACDVYATVGFAMGAEGLAFVDRKRGFGAYAIHHDLSATWNPGFEAIAGVPPADEPPS